MDSTNAAPPALVGPWRAHRAHLVNLAYRMLGDIGDAEDVVQEAFARLAAAEPGTIDDDGGWLAVVTSRLCLDQLRSAHRRRERPEDPDRLHDDAATVGTTPAPDPADRITLDDQVRRALADVLDRLGPAERVAFILHDVFRTPFIEIAEVLGRSPATCRQLAHRARVRVAEGSPSPGVGTVADHDAVTSAFIDACARGSLPALVAVLAPDVWGLARLGPDRPSVTRHGPQRVAATLLRHWQRATLVADPRADRPTVLAFIDRRPVATITFGLHRDRIRSVEVTAGFA